MTNPRIWLPVLVLLVAALISAGMLAGADDEQPPVAPPPPPLVHVTPAVLRDVQLDVTSQGVVAPRTSSELVAEVTGRIARVSPAFVAGAFVEPDTPLLWLDTADLEAALAAAEAELASRAAARITEEREAELAREEWDDLGEGEPHPLLLREPQLAQARAAEAAAAASVQRARRDLQRAVVRAPYAARVVERLVDPGAWVAPGTRLGRVDAVDVAEVRLPVRDAQLAHLDLPLSRDAAPREAPLRVTLEAEFAGARWQWDGRVVRSEGRLDPDTRMVHLVAEVPRPYDSGDVPGRPPLATGLFVSGTIHGRELSDVVVLPRPALRTDGSVWVVDADDRLRRRAPDVLRAERDRVLLRAGVTAGERVLVSVLEAPSEGLRVRAEPALDADVAAPVAAAAGDDP